MFEWPVSDPASLMISHFNPAAADRDRAQERRLEAAPKLDQFLDQHGLKLAEVPMEIDPGSSVLSQLRFSTSRTDDRELSLIPAPISIRGISLNTFGLPHLFGQGGSGFSRLAEIGDSLAASGADFVALQECWHDSIKVLIERSGFDHVVQGGQRLTGVLNNRGLIILSKHEIVAQDEIRYDRQVGVEWFSGKGVQWARLKLASGAEIDVFNTHLASGRSGVAADVFLDPQHAHETRMQQLTEFFSFVASRISPNIPVLLLGDFNFTVDSPEYKLASSVLGPDLLRLIQSARSGISPFEEQPQVTIAPSNPLQRNDSQHPVAVDFVFSMGANIDSHSSSGGTILVDKPLSDHFGIQFDLVLSPTAHDAQEERKVLLGAIAKETN